MSSVFVLFTTRLALSKVSCMYQFLLPWRLSNFSFLVHNYNGNAVAYRVLPRLAACFFYVFGKGFYIALGSAPGTN
jgi:hypothetical protein